MSEQYTAKPSALLHRLADVMDNPKTWHADGLQDPSLTEDERVGRVLELLNHVNAVGRDVYGRNLMVDVGQGTGK